MKWPIVHVATGRLRGLSMSLATRTRTERASSPTADRARSWFGRIFFNQLAGITFGDWWELLRENRFDVDLAFWPKAAVVTSLSVTTSLLRWWESRRFVRPLDEVEIRAPLFVLGHWRGGTTHLHNLLALDERFAYPNFFQVENPHTFLLAGPRPYGVFDRLLPSTRRFDNVAIGSRTPAEDEFATCKMSLRSPYMWSFPRNAARYQRYLTFQGVPNAELDRWKAALVLFLKKLTLLNDRPLILKSPPHTCRIKILLELFPEARFLHIRRDPFDVYRSTLHLEQALHDRSQFQSVPATDLGAMILERYKIMYDVYFEERALIPANRLHELAFEDLERDPIGEMRQAYQAIELGGFDEVLPKLDAYVATQSDYRKNEFRPLEPDLKRRIVDAWHRSFEEWG